MPISFATFSSCCKMLFVTGLTNLLSSFSRFGWERRATAQRWGSTWGSCRGERLSSVDGRPREPWPLLCPTAQAQLSILLGSTWLYFYSSQVRLAGGLWLIFTNSRTDLTYCCWTFFKYKYSSNCMHSWWVEHYLPPCGTGVKAA